MVAGRNFVRPPALGYPKSTLGMVTTNYSSYIYTHKSPVPTQGLRQGLTFNAFLESLAATLVGSSSLPLFRGLFLCFPAVSALCRGRENGRERGFPRD